MNRIVSQNFKGEWLNTIPSNWKQSKIKHLFKIKKKIAGELGYDVISITQHGAKIKDIESGKGQLSMDYSKYQLVETGDYLMNHMDLLTGYIDIANFNGVTSPDYRVFELTNINSNPKYFLYLFQHFYRSKIFYAYGRGSSHLGRWRFPTVEFENFYVPVPPIQEQKIISNYLDKKTRTINDLIEKTQKKIELLKEQKSSYISQYITKGLDLNVEMKESGVEWIGNVPKKWNLPRLKYLIDETFGGEVIDKSFWGEGDETLYTTSKKIHKSNYKNFNNERRTTDKDLLLSRNGDGVVHLPPKGCIFTNVVQLIRLKKKIDRKFLWYSLTSQIKPLNSYSDGDFIVSLNKEQWFNLFIPLPDFEEQLKITHTLDTIIEPLEKIIIKEKKRINLLKEYYQSLISDVITGKIRKLESKL